MFRSALFGIAYGLITYSLYVIRLPDISIVC